MSKEKHWAPFSPIYSLCINLKSSNILALCMTPNKVSREFDELTQQSNTGSVYSHSAAHHKLIYQKGKTLKRMCCFKQLAKQCGALYKQNRSPRHNVSKETNVSPPACVNLLTRFFFVFIQLCPVISLSQELIVKYGWTNENTTSQ